jgi:hypothetical protein
VVVAHNLDLGPELPEELDEVIGEAVVVVEYKNARSAFKSNVAERRSG